MGEDQEFRQATQELQLGFRTNVSRFRDAGVEFGFFYWRMCCCGAWAFESRE